MAWLQFGPPERLLRVRVEARGLVIGRDIHCDLALPDPQVAPRHADIRPAGGQMVLSALEGPVWVNGAATTRHPLADGDRISLGPGFSARYSLDTFTRSERTRPISPQLGGSFAALRRLTLALDGEPQLAERTVRVEGDSFVIGSGPECDLVLYRPDLSARHARLLLRPDGITVLEDLDSLNGVWLGGQRIFAAPLRDGQVFRLGDATTIVFSTTPGTLVDTGTTPKPVERFPVPLVGDSPVMVQLRERIRLWARGDAPVLVLGETGVGKELVARALHELSPRGRKPLVTLNMGAIPRDTAASLLFGHRRGAFTGAVENRAGAFAQAQDGSLFLDEVGELPLDLQPQLLRALGDPDRPGTIRPLGQDTDHTVNVRVISATHRDLATEVERGSFRRDLYYRLGVFTLRVPPLRERREDIPALVEHLSDRLHMPVVWSGAALAKLLAHHYPGNVRELAGIIQRSLAAHPEAVTRGRIEASEVELEGFGPPRSAPVTPLVLSPFPPSGLGFMGHEAAPAPPQGEGATAAERDHAGGGSTTPTLAAAEADAIRQALARSHGNRAQAARALGISRSTLYEKMKQLALSEKAP